MKNGLRLNFGRGDILAIALVALLALSVALCFMPDRTGNEDAVIQIFQDGKLIREIPLDEDTSLEIDGDYSNIILVQDQRVSISDSDCPGQDCMHSGWISEAGRSIVCLPNRVEVRIAGSSDIDFVVG